MGLTSHISWVYETFSSYRVFFSLMTSLTMMGLDPGHLVRALFHFLKILLIVSVAQITLVVSATQDFVGGVSVSHSVGRVSGSNYVGRVSGPNPVGCVS